MQSLDSRLQRELNFQRTTLNSLIQCFLIRALLFATRDNLGSLLYSSLELSRVFKLQEYDENILWKNCDNTYLRDFGRDKAKDNSLVLGDELERFKSTGTLGVILELSRMSE